MTDHAQEQEDEVEALQSIFAEGTEFIRKSPEEFALKLLPDPTGETENHVGVTLRVTYTPEYPDTAPDWEIEEIKGLSDENQELLRNKVTEVVESSLGMAMVYSMAETCQDFLKENNFKALSMHEEMLKRMKAEGGEEDENEDGEEDEDEGPNEEEEWKGLQDKPAVPTEERITVDSFNAWKVKFDEEMIACGLLKRGEAKVKTGRSIFMEQIAEINKADGNGASEADGKAPLVYDAALFGEEEDGDDLDDLSDGEGA